MPIAVVAVLEHAALAPLEERPHAVELVEGAVQGVLHEEQEPGVERAEVRSDLEAGALTQASPLAPSSLVAPPAPSLCLPHAATVNDLHGGEAQITSGGG